MKIRVRFLSDKLVEITLVPSWFGRLLRHRSRRGTALRTQHPGHHRGEYQPIGWFWITTARWVGQDIEENIECTPIDTLDEPAPDLLPRAVLESPR